MLRVLVKIMSEFICPQCGSIIKANGYWARSCEATGFGYIDYEINCSQEGCGFKIKLSHKVKTREPFSYDDLDYEVYKFLKKMKNKE